MGNTLNLGSKLTFDVNSGISAIRQLDSALAHYGATEENIDNITVKMNRSNEVTRITFRQLTDEGTKVTRTLRLVNGAYQETNVSVQETNKQLEKSKEKISNLSRAFQVFKGVLAGQIAFRTISTGITTLESSVTDASEFSLRIAQILTIAQGSDLTFNNTAKAVRKLSDEFGNPIIDTAIATYETLSNQVAKGSESFEFLREASKFAQATVSTQAESVDLLTSAINAFGLGMERTGQVSAIFFKGIDLGRFQTKDIANNFGRVAATANAIGVTLEETVAALATTTINGLKASEAMTGLNSVFSDLLKPTKELQKVFLSLGVESGSEGIATFGLPGFLERLNAAAKGSDATLASFFDNVRALRTIFQTTGDNASKFADVLNQVSTAGTKTAAAVDIVAQSAGKRFQVELTKTKNFFTVDFGLPILESLLRIGDTFGGLSNIITGSTSLILKGAGAYVIYKGSIVGVTLAVESLAAIQSGAGVTSSLALANSFFKVGAAADSAKISLGAYGAVAAGPVAAAAGIGAAIGIAIGVLTAKNDDLTRQIINNLNKVDDAIRNQLAFQRDAELSKEQVILNRIETTERRELSALADQRANIQVGMLEQDRIQKQLLSSFKEAEDSYFLGLNKTIEETRRRVRDAFNEIKSAREAILKTPSQLDKSFETRREALPTRNLVEVSQELTRVKNRRQALINSVGPTSEVQQVQDTFKAIDESLVREAALRLKIKEIRGINVKDRPRSTQLREENQLEAKRQENLANQKAALEAVIATKERMISVDQNSLSIQEANFKAQKRALEEFLKAKPKDSPAAFGEFVKSTVLATPPKTGEEQARQQTLFKELLEFKKSRDKQFDLESNRLEADSASKKIQTRAELQRKILKETNAQVIKDTATSTASLQAALERLNAINTKLPSERSRAGVNPLVKSVRETIEQVSAATKSGDLQSAQEALAKLDAAIQVLNNPARTSKTDNKRLLPEFKGVRDELTGAVEILTRLQTLRTQVNLVGLTAGVGNEFDQAGVKVDLFAGKFEGLERVAEAKLERIRQSIEAVKKALADVGASAPTGTGGGLDFDSGGDFAAGGFLPKSPDTMLAGFRAGESVLNPSATARFRPQITAMNAGRTPNFSQNMSTTVDSINIAVNESVSPGETAREVVKLINRELRRGSSRLGS